MPLSLFALFLAAFAFGTAEFVIAGVLPDVALGLGVSIPVAGYLVSGYAIGVAVGGPALAVLTKKLNRKLLVVLLGIGFTLGQALCAMAPNFELLLMARIFVSVLHGTYFGIAFVIATSIVPPQRRGFAMALILSGLTVSNVLGVPGGTAIGTMLDWRATFWAVGAFGLVASLVITLVLPANAGAAASQGSLRHEFAALKRQQVFLGFAIAVLVMVGQYSVFTYIAPLLLEVTGLSPEFVPALLLLYGIGATIGVFIGGRLADWRLVPSLLTIISLQVVMFTALYFISPHPVLMSVGVIIWGGVNFAVGSPLQSRMLLWSADAPNLTSTLIPAGFNIGIAIGAFLGAAIIDAGWGYQSLALIGVAAVAIAGLIALWSAVWEERARLAPPLAPVAAQ